MRRRVRTAAAVAVFVITIALVVIAPVASLGPRPPDIQASAQRAATPAVAVPVQAVGGAVLSTILTGALVISERRSMQGRKSRRATH
jgi:hypothetical protein